MDMRMMKSLKGPEARATALAFIYVIEHTKTKGGGVKKYAN